MLRKLATRLECAAVKYHANDAIMRVFLKLCCQTTLHNILYSRSRHVQLMRYVSSRESD